MISLRGSAIHRGGSRRHAVRYRLVAITIWFALVVVWELFALSGRAPAYVVAPSSIALTLVQLARDGELWQHISASLFRASTGFVIGATSGTLIGLLAGVNRFVGLYFDSLISLTYPVPKIAILPLLMAWLGIGNASKIAIIAMAVFYPTFINAYYGAKGVSRSHLWAAWNMGASPSRVFWRIVLPSALPQIFAGMRVATALSFIVLFAAEMIGARAGLGYLIAFAEDNLRFEIMYASLATIAVIGFAADRALLALRKRLLVGRAEIEATP
jgi:ABC-type nitrate/sulfonate/bicarbonate transport system permease component